jgi:hypothetical protein
VREIARRQLSSENIQDEMCEIAREMIANEDNYVSA